MRVVLVMLWTWAMFMLGAYEARHQPHIVQLTKVFACSRYAGSLVVISDGRWEWFSADILTQDRALSLQRKLPNYAVAMLDPTDADAGECPPHIQVVGGL